jgi:hypothetical protein
MGEEGEAVDVGNGAELPAFISQTDQPWRGTGLNAIDRNEYVIKARPQAD